jgi:hypothetical protein
LREGQAQELSDATMLGWRSARRKQHNGRYGNVSWRFDMPPIPFRGERREDAMPEYISGIAEFKKKSIEAIDTILLEVAHENSPSISPNN